MTIEQYIIMRNNREQLEVIQEEFGLSYEMVWTYELSYQCHVRKLSLEHAITFIQRPNIIVIEGKPFESFKQACDEYKVDSTYLYKKEKRTGIPKEILLQEKVKNGIQRLEVQYEGNTYKSFSDLCRTFQLDPEKVQSLKDNRNISREEAFTLSIKHKGNVPVNRRGITTTLNGKEYESIAAANRAKVNDEKE